MVLADTQISATRHVPLDAWTHGKPMQAMLDRHGIDLDVQSPYFGYELLTKVAEMVVRDEDLPPDLFELLGPQLGRHPRRTAKRWLELVQRGHQELLADDGLSLATLRSFEFPLLMMYGDRSRACTTTEFLRTLWPHAAFATVANAGHFFPTSRSSEVIAACESFWAAQLAMAPKVA